MTIDPNENIRQQIALLKKDNWTDEDSDQFIILGHAYNEWRSNGGFIADHELLVEFFDLFTRKFPNLTER